MPFADTSEMICRIFPRTALDIAGIGFAFYPLVDRACDARDRFHRVRTSSPTAMALTSSAACHDAWAHLAISEGFGAGAEAAATAGRRWRTHSKKPATLRMRS